nr:hypothetical protein [Comamonas koreensis]
MRFIATTASAVENLKIQAKKGRKNSGTSLASALDFVAQQRGYDHWKHVTVCAAQTVKSKSSPMLPQWLAQSLDSAGRRAPALGDTEKAFTHGFIFAMDVIDAARLEMTGEFVECADAWYLVARNLWPILIHYRRSESSKTLLESMTSEELWPIALNDMQNYRFFRYMGKFVPTSLKQATQLLEVLTSCTPSHLWLRGKFFSIESDNARWGAGLEREQRTRAEKFGHLDSDEGRKLNELLKATGRFNQEDADHWLFQLEKETPMGRARYQSLSSMVEVKWGNAVPLRSSI